MSEPGRGQNSRVLLACIVVLGVLLVASLGWMAFRISTLGGQRDDLRAEVATLKSAVEAADANEIDLQRDLDAKTKQLEQLTGDATGKDVVIKQLQDDGTAKQAQIDSLSAQRVALKGCLDGVTLALVQISNNGNSAARATLDGVRDTCRQAEVLL